MGWWNTIRGWFAAEEVDEEEEEEEIPVYDQVKAQELFRAYDTNRNGRLSWTEFEAALASFGEVRFKQDDRKLFDEVANHNGTIGLEDVMKKDVQRRLRDRMELGKALRPPVEGGGLRFIEPDASFKHNKKAIEDNCKEYLAKLGMVRMKQEPMTDTYLCNEAGEPQHPLVDLVMEGGGTLGLALVGFAWALEEAGVRFRSVAGTSAGAINAAFLASSGAVSDRRAHLANAALNDDFAKEFVDNSPTMTGKVESPKSFLSRKLGLGWFKHGALSFGWWLSSWFTSLEGTLDAGKAVRKLAHGPLDQLFSNKLGGIKAFLKKNALTVYTLFRIVWIRLGLVDGQGFEDWLDKKLRQIGGCSTLEALLGDGKHLHLDQSQVRFLRKSDPSEQPPDDIRAFVLQPELAMVTTDITTGSRVIFPRHAPAYFEHMRHVRIARLVRACMSVPIFFKPLTIKDIPNYDPRHPVSAKELLAAHPKSLAARAWTGWPGSLNYDGSIPSQATFVDGGLVSNFPLDVFHMSHEDVWLPSVGVKLGVDYVQPSPDEPNLSQLMGGMLNTMRRHGDATFLAKNQAANRLVTEIWIPGSVDSKWLSFNLDDRSKAILYAAGVRAAIGFLEKFDWEHYKKMRRVLYQGQHEFFAHNSANLRDRVTTMAATTEAGGAPATHAVRPLAVTAFATPTPVTAPGHVGARHPHRPRSHVNPIERSFLADLKEEIRSENP
ncbi:hypothetical protein PTSG_04568 [Salpingoeca rosetta]|uniref:PNPLA domain-containing protein n=1 Tax=Salpingoeca rosetta (strain ATCC 50818 / BSB-021) TaxID=946362 RepID=F2U7T4_SALR5|nr:uncharacterized protein PTSG_04568 [Salpingoeca rosetta]EGD72839.1 hypothetical protein PTSG_04568 [Salpingoeca rosetta]|eukprot:XP_004994662.1 hypothetical protein PTSG_04568 [Salpingoeca rosetta]